MAESQGTRQRYSKYISAVVAAATIGALVWLSRGEFVNLILNGRIAWAFVYVQPLVVLSLLLIALRLVILAGPPIGILVAFEAVCVTQVAVQMLPTRVSELAKPLYLKMQAELSLQRGVWSLLIERVLDLLCVCLLALFLASMAMAPFSISRAAVAIGLIAISVFAAVAAIVVASVPHRTWAHMVELLPYRLRGFTISFVRELKEAARPRRLALACVISAPVWASAAGQFIVFFHFAGTVPLTPMEWLVVFVVSTFGLAIAVAPGGLGTFEGAIIIAMSYYGYSVGEAATLALVFRFSNILLPTLVTVGLIAVDRFRFGQLVQMLRWRSRQKAEEGEL